MAIISRSARGEIVDFELLGIKQQLANSPINVNVASRQSYVDIKDGVKKKPTDKVDNQEFIIPVK